jgi:hypothetical protein
VDDVYEDLMAGMSAIEQRRLEGSPDPLPFLERIEIVDGAFYEITVRR